MLSEGSRCCSTLPPLQPSNVKAITEGLRRIVRAQVRVRLAHENVGEDIKILEVGACEGIDIGRDIEETLHS